MTLGELISKFREDHNLSMDKFAEMSGLSKGYISMLERNSNPKTRKPITPTLNTFAAVADAMNMDLNTIIRVVDANQKINLGKDNNLDQQNESFEFVDLSNSVNIPVVGTIPAGFAMEAVENILGYIDIPADWTKGGKEYVGLKVSGDSMYPLFLDGDTVVIQLQNTAENGDICACYVNGFDIEDRKSVV